MSIAILCPTRGRPDRFSRMLESALRTASGKFEVLAYIDDDDPRKDEYLGMAATIFVGPRIDLGPSYEFLRHKTSADLVMMGADDLLFRTHHWDRHVRQAGDLLGVLSFNDGATVGHEDGHPFVGREFISRLGSITNPNLKHSCIDNWVVEIAKEAGRFKTLDIRIEHEHPKYGKGAWDQTYKDNSREQKLKDGSVFQEQKKRIPSLARLLK